MSDQFVAEIRIFPYTFAPTGWAFCNGGLLPISQNTALFALLGTTYGGDGKSTFALPDMVGRSPMHPQQGPGLSNHFLGEEGGTEFVTLLQSEIPAHAHTLMAQGALANQQVPTGNSIARVTGALPYRDTASNLVLMAPQALAPAGGDLPHNNLQPYLVVNFCIAMQGVFPPRT